METFVIGRGSDLRIEIRKLSKSPQEITPNAYAESPARTTKLSAGLGSDSIGISLGQRLGQPNIVPIDVVVEIDTAIFIHSCCAVQDQHRNR